VDKEVLRSHLDEGRRHVSGILEGLTEPQLQQPVLPSGWTCVGLVNHLAVDVERFWFRAVMANDRAAWDSLEASGSAWDLDDGASPESVLARYEEEIRRSDEIIAVTPLDAAPAAWPDELFGAFRLDDLGQVILHVITETACHAGHLDAARELLDGGQWMVLDAGRQTSI
jgi:hypothetical protein